MNSRKLIKKILIGISLAIISLAGGTGIVLGESLEGALAIKGYDPVAYFKEGKALNGSESFIFPWHGMVWHFSTKENRDLFAADPGKYAPQYDGYCAWAMTEARKAKTDPEMWEIFNGKLYLNCNRSAHEKWRRDIPGNIQKADANWKKLSGGN